MLDKFTYTNHNGDVIQFGENGIYANYNDLRDYAWTYTTKYNKLTNVYHAVRKFTIPIVFTGDEATIKTNRNRVFEVFEADSVAGVFGTIDVNGWSLSCMVVESSTSNYLENGYMKTSVKLATDSPMWTKQIDMSFFKAITASNGFDYPHDYPHGFAQADVANVVSVDHPFASDFRMIIYGPCSAPSVTIAGHKYSVTGTVASGERVVIDSRDKSVTHVASDGTETNWFLLRYKSESIFEKIPGGDSPMTWDGSFGFDLQIFAERSEPPFDVPEVPDGALVDAFGRYLFDSNDDYLVV